MEENDGNNDQTEIETTLETRLVARDELQASVGISLRRTEESFFYDPAGAALVENLSNDLVSSERLTEAPMRVETGLLEYMRLQLVDDLTASRVEQLMTAVQSRIETSAVAEGSDLGEIESVSYSAMLGTVERYRYYVPRGTYDGVFPPNHEHLVGWFESRLERNRETTKAVVNVPVDFLAKLFSIIEEGTST